ncbi:transposase [Streptomyces sp. NPDC046831]|uniref:transposase n=1 Tax=Streptomyces sp. NPDC046831 TaxID=3154805 RepID=UPI00340EB479
MSSVEAASAVREEFRGHDPREEVDGRERHVVVDGRGLPLAVMGAPAGLVDPAAATGGLCRIGLTRSAVTAVARADSAYGSELRIRAHRHLHLTIRTLGRPETSGSVLSRRQVVERPPARIMDTRRHARDYERLIQHSETLITRVLITPMTRRSTGLSGEP